ncbi:hypothetical protein Tco_1077867 [Tanacetum coccineum]
MSDLEDSTVTYMAISSPFGGLLDIGSLGVDGPPMMPEDPYAYVVAAFQAPPSPDYVPGSKEPEQAPPLPEFVPKPAHPEFMPPKDDVLPAKEQPLPAVISPTADSPGYIPESGPKKAPEEEDDEDPDEDLADYPTDRDDDEEEEPSGDEADDKEEDKDDEEEEEEASVAMMRAAAPSTYILAPRSGIHYSIREPPFRDYHLLIPIYFYLSITPLLLPSTDCRAGVSEATFSSAPTARPTEGCRADYGFVGTLDDEIRRDPMRYVSYGITDTSGRILWLDRRAHARTAKLMETEAKLSCEAWVQSMDASDTARSETQVTAFQSQQGPASGLARPEIPEEAGSSS